MAKTKTPKTPLELKWRIPDSREYYTDEHTQWTTTSRRYVNNRIIGQAEMLGFCTIREKATKGTIDANGDRSKRIIQRVELCDYDIPDTDVYLCLYCHDFLDRQLCFIVEPTAEKYLLALPRNGGQDIIITNEDILFAIGENPLHTRTEISVADMSFLKLIITEWCAKL